jgi:methylated-DNA-[protein]-cysteine S-methyltransferase
MESAVWQSPFGEIRITATEKGIGELHIEGKKSSAPSSRSHRPHPAIRQTGKALSDYFSGKQKTFSLPLDLRGTPFQKAVWRELLRIPYGQTRTYGEIARRIGKPRAARAVGMACHRNPVGIIIPCHRVIGADGSLTGYAGGLKTNRALLDRQRRYTQLKGC